MRNKHRERELLLIENAFSKIWSLLPCQILLLSQLDFYLHTLQVNSDGGSLGRGYPTWQQEPVQEEKEEQSRITSMKLWECQILNFSFYL